MNKRFQKILDEPTMSDKTLLVSVEDLISGAFGSTADNIVNVKLIQMVLRILARQLRLLEQDVEIKFDDLGIDGTTTPTLSGKPGGRPGGHAGGHAGGQAGGHAGGHAGGRGATVGSIEVVTVSEFSLLEQAVKKLTEAVGPLPTPSMPDNQQLRADLAKGRASLSDTMEAMQLSARVKAAEDGLFHMAELLTQLAAAGLLPAELAGNVIKMRTDLKQAAVAAEHAGKDEKDGDTKGEGPVGGTESEIAAYERPKGVKYREMIDVINYEKGEINKEIQNLIARANHTADTACSVSKNAADKMEVAVRMNDRVTTLHSQTVDYANQLRGFDAGLTTQMASFQEQMGLVKNDLLGGLKLFETANNSAETAAILDLNERCEVVSAELDSTVHQHQCLTLMQQQLNDELRNLIECLEMLREQKADRDEVNDGLRDKADNSCLVGLLQEEDFAEARFELDQRIAKSYEKFHKQEAVWHRALEDLLRAADIKAPIIVVIALKKSVEEEVNNIQRKLQDLEIMLGKPKAAILMRKLATDTACAACLTRALMLPNERTCGMPAQLPPLRRARPPEPCLADPLVPPDLRKHICHRWVGGSHTLVASNVARERLHVPHTETIHTKKYDGYGTDGRSYYMEEDMQPCAECNKFSCDDRGFVSPQTPTATDGGGDQVKAQVTIKEGSSDAQVTIKEGSDITEYRE